MRGSAPGFPGCFTGIPKIVEQLLLSQRIHALPEALVLVGHELAFRRQAGHRAIIPLRVVIFDVVENLRLEDEECAIDPALRRLGVPRKLDDKLALDLEVPEARDWMNRRQRGELPRVPGGGGGADRCR